MEAEYIADTLADRIMYAAQSWGTLGLNTAVRPKHREPSKMRIKDSHYGRGLGMHADGEVVIDLRGEFRLFEAEIGIQWHGGTGTSSVIFRVLVDGEKRFESPVVRESDAPRPIRVPVDGADDLVLVADSAGDGIACDVANWANARLTRNPAAKAKPGLPPIDVAQFAQVVTWDPAWEGGKFPGRVQEFPAAHLFRATDLLPDEQGRYAVPTSANGEGSIGLLWREERFVKEAGLQFARSATPPADDVRLQHWSGISAWQGSWKEVEAEPERDGTRWTWRLPSKAAQEATQKLRWLFAPSERATAVQAFTVHTRSLWRTAQLRVEAADGGRHGRIDVYNGEFVTPPTGATPLTCKWDTADALRLAVRYARTWRCKTDRTVLRFRLPGQAFAVAVEDVLAKGCVYLPHAGVFVPADSNPMSLAAYRKDIAGRKTVLDRVREMPDRTFAQAMAKTHNPIQDRGPMMLSLACDERKFTVQRDGVISFRRWEQPSRVFDGRTYRGGRQNYPCQLRPTFDTGEQTTTTRHLHGGWLPAPVTIVREKGIVYRQRTYVAPVDDAAPPNAPKWLRTRAVCVAELTIENTNPTRTDASLTLAAIQDAATGRSANLRLTENGAVAMVGKELFAYFDTSEAALLVAGVSEGELSLRGSLPPRGRAQCSVYLPAWGLDASEYGTFRGPDTWLRAFEAYWRETMEGTTEIELPDELLTNIIRASQVHCLLAAGNEDLGERIDPWTSADRYGALESESQPVIRGMDMMGHRDFARRALKFFVKRYNRGGYLTTGYTMMGTGWHLWTLADHVDRTDDRAWFESIAPDVARVCRWIVSQREKTKRLGVRGRRVPQYGLTPPGVIADWPRFTHSTFQEAHYCAGLREAARVLLAIGHPDAAALSDDAREYREDIVHAYRWTQARTPALAQGDGTWMPSYPPLFLVFGDVGGFFPGEDGSRAWAKNAMAHHLAANGILDPASDEVGWMLDQMEDVEFLRTGLGDYPESRNRQDFFNLGGFNKSQPYYRRNVELYAFRDDIKPFIRSYFNTLASLVSRENLSLWEHFHNRGGWNKTHETGWFLTQTRIMLLTERGDDLWLAPFVTRNWLKHGLRISVRHAPTRFGPVSFTIESFVDEGRIKATIEPPTRLAPRGIVLRLRHPTEKPIRSVHVNGELARRFDPSRETVTLAPQGRPIAIDVTY